MTLPLRRLHADAFPGQSLPQRGVVAADPRRDGGSAQGNPPEKPEEREVEVFEGEFLHEEVKVYRQPDHGRAQAGGGWLVSARVLIHQYN